MNENQRVIFLFTSEVRRPKDGSRVKVWWQLPNKEHVCWHVNHCLVLGFLPTGRFEGDDPNGGVADQI